MEKRRRIPELARMIFGLDERVQNIAKYLNTSQAYICF